MDKIQDKRPTWYCAGTMAKRTFHLVDADSNKFWGTWIDGNVLHTQYGRIGTAGKTTSKLFGTSKIAHVAMAKIVAEKVSKGYVEVTEAEARDAPKKAVVRPPPAPLPSKIDEEGFWDILSRLNWKKQGDDEKVLEPALKALSQMSKQDIAQFDVLMAQKLFALDTREHARAVYKGEVDPDDGDQYISADDFLYSRCVMLVNGREAYEAAVKDPTLMPQGSEFEAILYLAREAYQLKTGEELDVDAPVSYESFSNKEGWAPTAATKAGKATDPGIPPLNRRPS